MKAKALALLALAGISCMVAADELPISANHSKSLEVEHYAYGMHPDIARVIRTSAVPNVCQAAPVQMTYEDHHGQRHVMEYMAMGKGCTN